MGLLQRLGAGMRPELSFQSDQFRVWAINFDHFIVCAALDNPASIKHDYLIAVPNRAQAMGDDQASATAAPYVVVYDLFRISDPARWWLD